MAFNAATEWDVRTTGSDTNGGGFQVGATGTDFSQQDSAQVTYTDLVIDGTTNTKVTSAAHPFDSTSPGNIINITSGTGFTVQRVQIVSVTGSTATCDKSLGTLGSTGGNGKLGGSLAVPLTAMNLGVSTNTVWIKAGTYTQTTTSNWNNASVGSMNITGYQTTHGDGGTKPLMTTATNSVNILSVNTGAGTGNIIFRNISFSNTAGTRGDCFFATGGLNNLIAIDCVMDGFRFAVNGDNNNFTNVFSSVALNGCEIKNTTNDPVRNRSGLISITGCYIHGCSGTISTVSAGIPILVDHTIFAATTGIAITSVGVLQVSNCTFSAGSSDAINLTSRAMITNCIFYGQTGSGKAINSNAVTNVQVCRNNAYGSNAGGNLNNVPLDIAPVSLSAGPFTNSGSGDYSLNSTAGGGAACKGAGFPGAFPGGTSTGSIDIGAVQTAASVGASLACNPFGGFIG